MQTKNLILVLIEKCKVMSVNIEAMLVKYKLRF